MKGKYKVLSQSLAKLWFNLVQSKAACNGIAHELIMWNTFHTGISLSMSNSPCQIHYVRFTIRCCDCSTIWRGGGDHIFTRLQRTPNSNLRK